MASKNRGFSKEDELISFSPVRENSYSYKKQSIEDIPVGGTMKTFEQLVQEQLNCPDYTTDNLAAEASKHNFLKKKHTHASFSPRIKPSFKEKIPKEINYHSDPKTKAKKKQKFLKRGQGTLCVKTKLNKSEKDRNLKDTPETSRPLDSLPTPVSLEESSIKQRQNVTITKPKQKSTAPKPQKKPELEEDAIEFDPDVFEAMPDVSDELEEKLQEINQQVYRLREQRQAIKQQTKHYETKTLELEDALEKFRNEKEDIIKGVESWKIEEIRKLKKERLNHEKNVKFTSVGNKKELEEIEEVRTNIDKLKEESASMDNRQILTMDKLKKQLDEFNTQNVLLEQELRYLEKRRIQTMNEPKNTKKKSTAPIIVQAAASSQQVLYKNGAKKEVFPDGRILIIYPNGDSKESFPDGKQIYNFSEAGTIQTSMADGLQIIEFQNGQIEKHFPDGNKEIRFGDGSIKQILPDGSEEISYPDGTVQRTDCKKVKCIEFPNGYKDIIHPNSNRKAIQTSPGNRKVFLYPELLKKGFPFESIFGVSFYSKHPEGSNTKAKVKQIHGKTNIPDVSALVSLNYVIKGVSLTHDVKSNKEYKGTVEYVPDTVKDLKVKAELTANFEEKPTYKKNVSAEYAWPNVKAKAAVTDEPVLKASAVTGNEKFGAALDLGWSFGASRLTTYNAALWWFENQNRLVLKHESTNKQEYALGKFVLSAFKEHDKFNFGGALNYNVKSGDVGLEVGLQKNTSDTQQFKVRLDSEGQLGLSVRHKLTNSVSLITATQLGIRDLTKETGPSLQFGFKVKVSP